MSHHDEARNPPSSRPKGRPGAGVELDLSGRGTEAQLGSTPRARAANEAMRALARSARAFALLEPDNPATLKHLEEAGVAFDRMLAQFGEVTVAVQPSDLTVDDETVYHEKHRDASLAVRLHRDGVRSLRFTPGFGWDELSRLVEVLALRYLGVWGVEDDVVTLLWRAELAHLRVGSVNGYVADVERDGGEVQGSERREVLVPPDFDLPAPGLHLMQAPAWAMLDHDARMALLGEEEPSRIPRRTVGLFRALLAAVEDPADPLQFEAVVPFIFDTRDYLVADGQAVTLLMLYEEIVQFLATHTGVRGSADALLQTFLTQESVARLVASLRADVPTPPEALGQLLDLLPDDHLPLLFALLDTERGDHPRRIVRQLIERHLPERLGDIVDRLGRSRGGVAADLLRVVANGAPEATEQLLGRFVGTGDADVEVELVYVAERMRYGAQTRMLLTSLLRSPDERLRVRVLESFRTQRDVATFPVLWRFAETRAAEDPGGGREFVAVGRALAAIDPDRVPRGVREWCNAPAGRGGGMQTASLCTVALAALEVVPSTDADEVLRLVAARGPEALRPTAFEILTRRRRSVPPGVPA